MRGVTDTTRLDVGAGRSTQRAVELVGREPELQLLLDHVELARAGQGNSITLCAEPGIGKTTLVEAVSSSSTTAVTVLRCYGLESEVELPFSGLHQLLLPVLARIDDLPPGQSLAIRAAVELRGDQTISTIDVALGALTLLTQLAAEQPILLIVDDAHWMDAATMQVLTFVGRRIERDAVLLLFATRPTSSPLRLAGPQITLGPLSAEASGALAERCAGKPLLTATTNALHDATGGNPLAIIETVRRLGDDLDQFGTMLDDPLPASALIELGFANRMAGLPRITCRALGVVATSVTNSAAVIDAAIRGLEIDPQALDGAEDAGVIERRLGTISFSHPLLRALVFHDVPPTEHRTIHGALASVSSEPCLRAWHAGAAARSTDEQAGADLAAAAQEFQERGGHLASARALERAARLTADEQVRAERLLAAALSAREASRMDWAAQLLAEALDLSTEPRLEVEIRCKQASLALWSGSDPAHGTIEAAELAIPVDADLARWYLAAAALELSLGGDQAAAAVALWRLHVLGPSGDRAMQERCNLTVGLLLVLSGRDPAGGRSMIAKTARWRLTRDGLDDDDTVIKALVLVEEFELAAELADVVASGTAAAGNVRGQIGCLTADGYRRFRIGEWAGAEAGLGQAIRVAEATGERYQLALAVATLALLQGARGDAETFETVERARGLVTEHRFTDVEPHLMAAVGAHHVSLGRGRDALVALEQMESWCQGGGYLEPSISSWQTDLVDAYAMVGQIGDAEYALDRLRQRSAETGRVWPAAAIARLEGVLSDHSYAPAFERAIELLHDIPAPFELARTHLQFGRRLRRAGQRSHAGEQLMLAEGLFQQLGAPVWGSHVTKELGALGMRAAAGTSEQRPTLTSQETVVAECIAQGMTNKEAAAHLFLTPKTIEWHLRQIYRKLEIKSRVQLATYIRGDR